MTFNVNHKVTVQRPIRTQDSETGEITVVWQDVVVDVGCDIQDVSVNQFIQSQAMQSRLQANVIFPQLPDITLTKDMRLKATCFCHDGQIFNPEGFLRDKKTGFDYFTIPCSQGVNSGDD